MQVKDDVGKYTKEKTTSSMYIEVNPGELPLPSVTLCPGFKQGVFESVEAPTYPHILKTIGRNKSMPTTEEKVSEWFKGSTYDLDEGTSSKQWQILFRHILNNHIFQC